MKRWPYLHVLTWALLGVCIWQVHSFRSALELKGDARSSVRISWKAKTGEFVDHNATRGMAEDPLEFARRRRVEVEAMKAVFPETDY